MSVLVALAVQFRLVAHGKRWPQVKTYHSSLGTAEKQCYGSTVSTAGHSSHVSNVLNFILLARVFMSRRLVKYVIDDISNYFSIYRCVAVLS